MRKICFVAALLVLCLSAGMQAQVKEVKIKNGPTFDPKGTIGAIVGQVEDVIYYTSWKRGPWLGAVRSKNLSQVYEKELELPKFNGKESSYRGIYLLGTKLVMICELYDKDKNKKYLLAQKIDDSGKFEGKPIEIESINTESKRNSGNFTFDIDSSKGRILIYADAPASKYSKEKFRFKVLNQDLQVVWEEQFELPYPDKFFGVSNYIIDGNDKLFMTCKFDEYAQTKAEEGKKKAKEDAKERGGNWYTYKIVSFDPKSGKVNDYDIKLERGQAIVSFDYNLDVNGNLNVAGLYANDSKSIGADGVYFIKIDAKTEQVISSSIKEFDPKMIQEYLVATLGEKRGNKRAEKGDGIENFVVDRFVNRTDGGLIISGEMYHSYTVCTTDPKTGATRCSTHYVYGFIMAVSVSPSGEVEWLQYIPKNQHTVNDGGFYSSYGFLISGENMYFFFNDNAKNYGPKKKPGVVYNMTASKGAVTSVAKISSEGKRTMEPDPKLRAEKKLLRPKVATYVAADNKLILLGKLGKSESLVEINIED